MPAARLASAAPAATAVPAARLASAAPAATAAPDPRRRTDDLLRAEDNPLTILPDWCCEVLSPRTASDDLAIKLPFHARSGVSWVWIVDPTHRLVEVFETVAGRPTLAAIARDKDRIALPPFDGEISVGSWWLPGPEA
ncbi:Uma2 family endonuclease [Sorangium sp. So ce854]|uniref:Uma2 family endonuclease n=1 Tax=Sorangium sp. So ce854 TaxID=3133322 RepID=UPI003F600861